MRKTETWVITMSESHIVLSGPRSQLNFPGYCALGLLMLCSPVIYSQSVSINFEVFGLNENQIALDNMLVDTCASIGQVQGPNAATQDLLNTCAVLSPLDDDDAGLASGLDRLIPEETFAISDSLTDASDLQVTNVQSRINALRSREIEGADENSGGGAASDGLRGSNIEPFFTSQFSTGEYDGNRLQQDADLSTNQFTAGADYRVSSNFIVGAGLGFFRHETDFRSTAGGSDADGVNATVFGTFMRENLGYVDVVLDLGSNSYDLSRQINLEGGNRVLASAETDSSSVALTVGAGRNFRVTDWDLNSYIRAGFISASVDGYSERTSSTDAGFGSTLRVASQSIKSTTVSLGTSAARTISTSRAVLVPQITVEIEFETELDKDSLSAYFLADPNQTSFGVEGEERDSEYLNFGLGGVAVFAQGRSAYAYYETRLAHDLVNQHWFKAGLRIEF